VLLGRRVTDAEPPGGPAEGVAGDAGGVDQPGVGLGDHPGVTGRA
jgi:hypothetical protein